MSPRHSIGSLVKNACIVVELQVCRKTHAHLERILAEVL